MKRIVDQQLQTWKTSAHRKPLIIRGARQVGKTSAIRNLGESFTEYVEINFESHAKWSELFQQDLDPKRIVMHLELMTNQKITPGHTLLFFDEIL